MADGVEDGRATVFLAMPTYGGVTPAAASAFFGPNSRDHLVFRRAQGFSLLANTFNHLWCEALNLREQRTVHYFGMQHGDVAPEVRDWVDVLIAELESHGLDVLSAVVPIKDPRGLTSTAVGGPGDRWVPARRLTMTEVYDLPETFTIRDIPDTPDGGCLLVNTGLWVCRFDSSWVERVRFTIDDCVHYDREAGAWKPRVEPEDWNFSRQLDRLGLKVGATRKVPLAHAGEMSFTNKRAWGAYAYDRDILGERPDLEPEPEEPEADDGEPVLSDALVHG